MVERRVSVDLKARRRRFIFFWVHVLKIYGVAGDGHCRAERLEERLGRDAVGAPVDTEHVEAAVVRESLIQMVLCLTWQKRMRLHGANTENRHEYEDEQHAGDEEPVVFDVHIYRCTIFCFLSVIPNRKS